VNTKGKDFVLAVLMIPLMYPLLLAAVSATTAAVLGGNTAVAQFWQGMAMIGGYDAIMLVAAFGLYEFVLGA
jgi:heme exporter protein B